ncbi:MAG: PQQ-dependent sugar dehydrogenase [Pseudomonadota bacterium]
MRDCHDTREVSIVQSAAAMAWMDDGRLAVFVSDFMVDDFNRLLPGAGPQSPDSDLGKTIAIDPESRAVEILSFGHRNGGGIAFRDGRLWVVEHGARGGDEINLIEAGNNYGWPYETLGTDYHVMTWPPDSTLGTHGGDFTLPKMAFVPSIAPSSAVVYRGGEVAAWDGDLIIGTLRMQSIYRGRIRDDAVLFAEPIPLGERIRDVAVDGRGRIYALVADGDHVKVIEAGEEDTVDTVLADARRQLAGCNSCRQLDPTDRAEYVAPTLVGVSLRPIASVAGFAYSDALSAREGVWSKENLRNFLLRPEAFSPGTSMPRQEIDRDEINDFLQALLLLSPAP